VEVEIVVVVTLLLLLLTANAIPPTMMPAPATHNAKVCSACACLTPAGLPGASGAALPAANALGVSIDKATTIAPNFRIQSLLKKSLIKLGLFLSIKY
jgi:hypothetical protein